VARLKASLSIGLVIGNVIVAVDVIGHRGPVAVHVHGNDTVIVIRPVDGSDATAASPGR